MSLDDLDENYKACGFCATPTGETLRFTDDFLEFLELCLDVRGTSLPIRVCSGCFDGAKQAKKFKDKCLSSFEKLKSNSVASQYIWGRSKEDRSYLKKKFDDESSNGRGYAPSLDYDPDKTRLMLPKIDIYADEKDIANSHLSTTKSGRVVKKKKVKYEDDDYWDGDYAGFCNVKDSVALETIRLVGIEIWNILRNKTISLKFTIV